MTVFASEIAEQAAIEIPDVSDVFGGLAPFYEQAWSAATMPGELATFLDLARGEGVAKLAPALAEGLDVIKGVPAGPVLDAIIGAVRTATEIQSLAGRYHRARRIRRIFTGERTGKLPNVVNEYPDHAVAFRDRVSLPWWTDCRGPFKAARLRTVVPPQTRNAPWHPAGHLGGGYPPARGNCSSGYAVGCGDGDGRKRWPGAGGKPCEGYADFSALLFPWWTASQPPGPIPAVRAGDVPNNLNAAFYTIDPNPDVLAIQARLLGDLASNVRVPLARVVQARAALLDLRGQDRVMTVAPASANYTINDRAIDAGVAMLDAFIAARAAWVRSTQGRDYLERFRGGSIDPSATAEASAGAPKFGIGASSRPPGRPKRPRARPERARGGGEGLVLAGAVGLLAGTIWFATRKK